jgi:two-component system OmpR family response regulator
MQLTWREQPVPLTVTEYWIVEALARHPGHVKSRQQLMDAANTVLDDNTVTSHIKRIRRKFQHLDADFAAIETAYGLGYRWLDP